MAEERLQKVLAARGVASRRAAEELILEGRVRVDGRVVVELGTKVDPERAEIRVDGRPLARPRPTYLLLNKPRGYLTTASDPEGRRTVFDLIHPRDQRERVFPVGRLDMDSEGLLLLTNDGELANRVAHPRYRIDKEYHALVEGTPSPGALAQLRRGGLLVEGGRTSPAQVEVIGQEQGGTWLRVIIHEGRKRQVRRMLEEIGHRVRRLRRIRLGQLTLAGLPAASYRRLTAQELSRLRRMVGLAGDTGDAGAEADEAAAGPEKRPPAIRLEEPARARQERRSRGSPGRPSGGPGRGRRAPGGAPERAGKPERPPRARREPPERPDRPPRPQRPARQWGEREGRPDGGGRSRRNRPADGGGRPTRGRQRGGGQGGGRGGGGGRGR